MKKKLRNLLLILGALLLFVSCSNGKGNRIDPTPGRVYNPISVEDIFPSDVIMNYKTEDVIEGDWEALLEDYVSTGHASQELILLKERSDAVTTLPVYDGYLDRTMLRAYLFYEGGNLVGTKTVLLIDAEGQIQIDAELEELLNIKEDEHYSDKSTFNSLINCQNLDNTFVPEGIIYSENSSLGTNPIGKVDGRLEMLCVGMTEDYGYWDLGEMKGVKRFSSIEEGKVNLFQHLAQKVSILSQMPVFEWDNQPEYSLLSYIRNTRVWSTDTDPEVIELLSAAEWKIEVPLLDENGEDGNSVLVLLYGKDELLAECVFSVLSEKEYAIECIKSEKDETGRYLGLEQIDYVRQANQLLKDISDLSGIKGLAYHEGKYSLVTG